MCISSFFVCDSPNFCVHFTQIQAMMQHQQMFIKNEINVFPKVKTDKKNRPSSSSTDAINTIISNAPLIPATQQLQPFSTSVIKTKSNQNGF